jgi:hypothetical protein
VGAPEGGFVGAGLGAALALDPCDGSSEGAVVMGESLGSIDGDALGQSEGVMLGDHDGSRVGDSVGCVS